jgi:D-alanyl-D-alanine carboxypeptidase
MRISLRIPVMILLLGLSSAAAQVTAQTTLSSTIAGKRVEAYLSAFNTGKDSVMREFFVTNLAKDALQRIPMDQRMERYRQLRATAQSFTLRKVIEVRDDHVGLVLETKNGIKLRADFEFEPVQPHGLVVIMLNEAEEEDEGVSRMKDDTALVAAVDAYCRKLSNSDEFSGVVMIARQGTPLYQKAFGQANKEKMMPNTPDTRFNLGSMNKSFTAVAVHQLAAQGKLSFSDTLKKFLPEYPNRDAATKVTVQQLLDMSSGIGDFFGERYQAASKQNIRSIRDYLPLFADKPLAFEPGTRRQYSNGGYIVLGAIIEKVSGMDYFAYVRQNIFLPAGMTASEWYEKDAQAPDIAIGYTRGEGPAETPRRPNVASLPQRGSSAGGGYSTVHDLLLYTMALKEGKGIPATYGGRNGLGIAGGTEGVNAVLEWNPKTGYAIIVLSNYDPPVAEKIARRVRAWLPEK